MYIWPGIKLQAYQTQKCNNIKDKINYNIKNGLHYTVTKICDNKMFFNKLDKDDKIEGDEMVIPLEDVCNNLCLSYAITYHKSQARTIHGSLRLAQTDLKCFSHRHLIVGLGRAPIGANVQVT